MTISITLSTKDYDIIDSGTVVTNGFEPVLININTDDGDDRESILEVIFYESNPKSSANDWFEVIEEYLGRVHIYINYGASHSFKVKFSPVMNNKELMLILWIEANRGDNLLLSYTWYLSKGEVCNG